MSAPGRPRVANVRSFCTLLMRPTVSAATPFRSVVLQGELAGRDNAASAPSLAGTRENRASRCGGLVARNDMGDLIWSIPCGRRR